MKIKNSLSSSFSFFTLNHYEILNLKRKVLYIHFQFPENLYTAL